MKVINLEGIVVLKKIKYFCKNKTRDKLEVDFRKFVLEKSIFFFIFQNRNGLFLTLDKK